MKWLSYASATELEDEFAKIDKNVFFDETLSFCFRPTLSPLFLRPSPQPELAMASAAALPDSRDLVATWSFLEEGVDHIMTRLSEGMSYSKYMYAAAFPLDFVAYPLFSPRNLYT